jgi:hypothetical protein
VGAHRGSSRHGRHQYVPRHRRPEANTARAALLGTAGAVVVGAALGLGNVPPDAPATTADGAAVGAIFHERSDRAASRGGLGRAPLLGANAQSFGQAVAPSPTPALTAPAPSPLGEIPAGCEDYSGNRLIGCTMLSEFGFGLDQMPALDALWTRESGWNHLAENPYSGAYGIPQALPGDKMASAGDDWRTNPATQIRWGLGYIQDRYGNPDGAWAFFQNNGWY